jgi:hypothetical protein
MRFLNAAIFAIGARATSANDVSRACKCARWQIWACKERTAVAEVILADVIHEMVKKELARPSNRSSRLTLPLGAAKT